MQSDVYTRRWEITYAAALGNGTTLDEWNRDKNHRQYYWLSFAKLFDKTRGPRRHDAMMYGFFQQGDVGFNTDIDGDGIDGLSVAGGEYNPAGPMWRGSVWWQNENYTGRCLRQYAT